MTKTKITPQMIHQLRQTGELDIKEKETKGVERINFAEVSKSQKDEEKIAQLKAQKETWAKKRIQEIEGEVKLLIQQRQEEARKRYEQKKTEEKKKENKEEQIKKTQVPEIATKPKKGLPFWGKRIKTAQQQAQPETAGRRVGG